MQLDKFFLYVEAAARKKANERKVTVSDLAAAISISLSGKGMKEYIAQLDVDNDGD